RLSTVRPVASPSMLRPPPPPPLFPYTTLFRSPSDEAEARGQQDGEADGHRYLHDHRLDGVGQDMAEADPPLRVADRARRLGEGRSEEHTSELQSRVDLVCRLLLEKKKVQKDRN